ncbi:MAG: 4-diphosphocytidyl-2C-methyl-D-erythritol kinase, partial [Alphaproteobacteria bacterium]
MIFGEMPLSEAEGAMLAHGLKGDGFSFRKGRVLDRADIDAIARAGIARVVAARLAAGDIGEDEAATAIARAIAGENLVVSAAFTGRANLYATAAGLVAYDQRALDEANEIHESITIALLPPHAPIAPRQMAATVKIIPFAAPRAALDAVLARVG